MARICESDLMHQPMALKIPVTIMTVCSTVCFLYLGSFADILAPAPPKGFLFSRANRTWRHPASHCLVKQGWHAMVDEMLF